MSKNIHCEECKNRLVKAAEKYGELYEFVEGTAKVNMFCDGSCFSEDSPKPIHKGDKCYASVLLPSRNHPNYKIQNPKVWAHDFINF